VVNRLLESEVMDDPSLEDGRHRHALRGLSRLNLLSGSARIVWPPIASLARRENRAIRILDVGSGAGDVPLALWRRARRAGIDVDILGVDVSSRAVRFARERAARLGASVEFHVRDALAEPLPGGFDVVLCSLFLHHLDDERAIQLLIEMKHAARQIALVHDLLRGDRGLWLARVASRLFTSSDVVHVDAPRSVRAAFTAEEMQVLARQAGMDDAEVSRRWPLRLLLVWRAA
jgi:SAM-dependent methyltransferase